MRTFPVDLLHLGTGTTVRGEFNYDTSHRFLIELRMPSGEIISANMRDYFESLCSIHRSLEARGIIPLCNGARRDVYPSGMQRDMVGGLAGYVLTMNRQTSLHDSVEIFGPTEAKYVSTVEEQREYFRAWCESVTGRRPPD